jgi:hypothetical protein
MANSPKIQNDKEVEKLRPTLEALADVDADRVIDDQTVRDWADSLIRSESTSRVPHSSGKIENKNATLEKVASFFVSK